MSQGVTDVRINGDGTVAAGTYGTVTINGAGSIAGDVVCRELRINGTARCRGSVRSDLVVVNGAGTFDGSVQANEFTVNGTTDVHAGVGAGRLKVAGTCGMDGGLAARDVEIRGDLRVGGAATVTTLSGEGRFSIGGTVQAERIDVRIHGRCSAASLSATSVLVRAPEGFGAIFSAFANRSLAVDSVEAADIELVDTRARLVRGSRVALGEGCVVDVVEYTESLAKLAGAQVSEERKVEPGA